MQSNSKLSLLILGSLFFIFGFVTWLNGILIPYLKIACELNNFQSLFVAFAFYISYFIMALPSSFVLKKIGFKKGMSLGLIIMALGALIFIPAAYSRTFSIFLSGLFIIGTGLSLLQTASNPYITIVGPIESAAKRISIMGICNKIAGVLAPIILGAIILADADILSTKLSTIEAHEKNFFLNQMALRVVQPYLMMAATLTLLSIMVHFSPLPNINISENSTNDNAKNNNKSILQYPHLILGVIALFLYVGAEVIAGDTIINYGISEKIALSEAKNFTSYTLSAMVVGYILGIVLIPKYLTQNVALSYSAILAILLSIAAMLTSGITSVACIAALGFTNAIMWPAIWPLSIEGLGDKVQTGSALLIMAIAGGAVMPLIYGSLSDLPSVGPKLAYGVLIPSYFFIFYFAWKGYKVGKNNALSVITD